jgi:hypothetical protein
LNVHKFDSNFIINFSEKFHDKWKLYVVKPHGKKISSISNRITARNARVDSVVDYKADPKIIETFLQKGLLNFQPGSHKKDFISKAFYNSVQNDNLPKGMIYETMGKTSLPEIYHLTSNSFSNAWLIDANFIKKNFPKKIVKASESDYDVGFIIEFSNKKLFIVSLAVSGSFLFIVVFVNFLNPRNDRISLWLRKI